MCMCKVTHALDLGIIEQLPGQIAQMHIDKVYRWRLTFKGTI